MLIEPYTNKITFINAPIYIIKRNGICMLGESVAVLKTTPTTHIKINLFNIITNIIKRNLILTLGASVEFEIPFPLFTSPILE